jgi:hypothetical protein
MLFELIGQLMANPPPEDDSEDCVAMLKDQCQPFKTVLHLTLAMDRANFVWNMKIRGQHSGGIWISKEDRGNLLTALPQLNEYCPSPSINKHYVWLITKNPEFAYLAPYMVPMVKREYFPYSVPEGAPSIIFV